MRLCEFIYELSNFNFEFSENLVSCGICLEGNVLPNPGCDILKNPDISLNKQLKTAVVLEW